MGDSLKEFLASRSRPLDDIPSEKHPDGKSYTFKAPPWKTCLTLKAMYTLGVRASAGVAPTPGELDRLATELAGEQAEEAEQSGRPFEDLIYRKVMGDTYDELVADGVDGDAMEAAFQLLLRKYGAGQDIAVQLSEAVSGESDGGSTTTPTPAVEQSEASKSSQASGGTPARTRARASTRASKTPAKPRARKTA